MSTDEMRAILKAKYNGSSKFDKMSEAQIRVIYTRLLNQGKLKGVTARG